MRLRFGECKASDSLMLISQDGSEEGVIRSNSQVCQRDDKDLFGVAPGCHVANDPGLVTGVEDVLHGEGTLDADLHSSSSKYSDDVRRRKRWNRQVVLHPLYQ